MEVGPVLYCSLEMQPRDLAIRSLSRRTGVPSKDIREGKVEVAPLLAATTPLRVWYDRCGSSTVDEVCSRIRSFCRRTPTGDPCALVVIDHLQRIGQRPGENALDHIHLRDTVIRLIRLVQEMEVPAILISPVNRAPATGQTPRMPTIADLAGSAAIESEADQAWLLFRHEAHFPGERIGEVDVFVGKNRHNGESIFATLTN